jgi:hypothetical protein
MIYIEAGYTGTLYPLTNPRIAAFPVAGTVTASSEVAGFSAVNANNALTWTYWRFTSFPATWQLTFTSAPINYCGIASHNIGSSGGQVAVQEWTGAAWVNIRLFTPTDDSPILVLFATRTTDRMRIRVTDAGATIGVIWFGAVLELPVKAQWTESEPFNEVVTSVYTDNVSNGGHVLDRFAERRAGVCDMEVRNVGEAWAAANIPALQTHMGALPVFMADRPSAYPKSVVFGMQKDPLRAPRRLRVLGAARVLNFSVIANEPA